MKSVLFETVDGEVGFGTIGLDGKLGYHHSHVFLSPQYRYWETISAHAPSRIQISIKHVTGHFLTFLNAGVLAGPIHVFLKAMEIGQTIRTALIKGKPWSGIMEHHYRDHRDWSHDDDQYLYQLCPMYHSEFFTPDIEKRFCVHLKGYPTKNWRNDFEFRDPCCAGFASILHIPDLAGTEFWKEWVNYEGNLPVLKMKSLEIGYRCSGYGMVVIGKSPDFGGMQLQDNVLQNYDETISAHANSLLEVDVKEEVCLAGAIHETNTNKTKQIIASFYLDEECIGVANRAGLEAFATGVPVVAQNDWGWKEMIEHGQTGFLGSNDQELAHYTAVLAHDEKLRQQIIQNAYEKLTTVKNQ
ncbi:MAG: glycosyltransferase [Planctomycetaceae bacterium]|jgi:hypothetical protein|nr:glycosyltransferase [Planctomycetaceae bacterium]